MARFHEWILNSRAPVTRDVLRQTLAYFSMRVSIAFGVVALTVIVFAIVWGNASSQDQIRRQTLIPYVAPTIPEDFQRDITYPIAASGPDGPATGTDDGPLIYAELHRAGWDGCLWSFSIDRQHGDEAFWQLDRSNDIFWQPQPDHHNVATNDGWFACVAQLQERLTNKTEAKLRLELTANLQSERRRTLWLLIAIGAVLAMISIVAALVAQRRAEPCHAHEGPHDVFTNGNHIGAPR